jgi:hypothetical protein
VPSFGLRNSARSADDLCPSRLPVAQFSFRNPAWSRRRFHKQIIALLENIVDY